MFNAIFLIFTHTTSFLDCRIHHSKDIKYQYKLLLITKELNKKKKGWNGLSRLLSPISTFYDNNSAVIVSNLDYTAIHQLVGQVGKNQSVTIPANPYNARTKVIERFFLEMQESFEKLLPSYIGTSIENKPARLKRNEKFHCAIHTEFIPTIQQTIQMINSWLLYKNSLPCPNDKSKTIQEMFNGVNKDKINDNELDDLMLAQEIKTISSQGIRFLNSWYFNDALYGIRQKVIIKYSLFDLSYISVYTISGKFLCRADRITLTHPLAHYTGEIEDIEDYKQKIQKQKQLKNKTIKACKEFLNIEDLEILKCDIEDYDQSREKATCKLIESKHAEGKEVVPTAVVSSKIKKTKEKPQKYNPKVKPLFRTSREKYEYLMEYGCTCNDDRAWLVSYKKSKEYLEYETKICTD